MHCNFPRVTIVCIHLHYFHIVYYRIIITSAETVDCNPSCLHKCRLQHIQHRRLMHVAGCTLRINSDLDKDTPLLLKPSGSLDGNRFFLPTPESDVLHFRAKERLLLACPGTGNNLVVNERQKTYKEASVSCDSGTLQRLYQFPVHFHNVSVAHSSSSI